MKKYRQIDIYNDSLIIEALLGSPLLLKTAQSQNIVSTIIDKVKDYFGSKVDPNDKAGSVLNMLGPGIITMTFSAMGMPWLGRFLGLADSLFHFNIAGILEKICGELKSELSGGKQVTSDKAKQIVQSAVESNNEQPTQEDADAAKNKANEVGVNIGQNDSSSADDVTSLASQLRFAKLIHVAMEDISIKKEAGGNWLSIFSNQKSQKISILSRILGIIFTVALASAGLLVAGDVMNKYLGRPNSLDGSIQKGKPVESSSQALPTSNREPKLTYKDVSMNGSGNWVESIPNNESSIQQMILNFAKEVYPVEGQESEIESSPMFQRLVNMIVWYNSESKGGPVVYIPRMFTTKKQLVDSFIDTLPENNVANKKP